MGDEPKSAATGKPPCLRTPEKLAADVIVAQIGIDASQIVKVLAGSESGLFLIVQAGSNHFIGPWLNLVIFPESDEYTNQPPGHFERNVAFESPRLHRN
jgi:hypothetical protein